jgi:hypothetical protein
MARLHQPGESDFRAILPEDIDWPPFPAFPRRCGWPCWSVNPQSLGLKVPAGERLMPHRHPEDRIYAVMSGVLHRAR